MKSILFALLLGFESFVITITIPLLGPNSSNPNKHQNEEALYLPNGTALDLVSFGYQHFLSHLLWFNTINYFGKHYRLERNYTWLSHMCDLVTRLNPRSEDAYQFCATMLAWEANEPDKSILILDRAVEHHPDKWLYWYLRGFTHIFFFNDTEKGSVDLKNASLRPGVPTMIVSLASKQLVTTNDAQSAINFLTDAIKATEDKQSKSVLIERLKEAYYELDIETIEQALKQAVDQTTTDEKIDLSRLENLGLLPKDLADRKFTDPFGGKYYIDEQTKEVKSTSNKKRSSIRWNNTAKLKSKTNQ